MDAVFNKVLIPATIILFIAAIYLGILGILIWLTILGFIR